MEERVRDLRTDLLRYRLLQTRLGECEQELKQCLVNHLVCLDF